MNFKQALLNIVQTESREKLFNPFYLYSRLCDLCTSYEDKEKVEDLFELDKRLGVIKNILTDGALAAATLKSAYPAVKDIITIVRYNDIIDCVTDVIYPQGNKFEDEEEYVEKQEDEETEEEEPEEEEPAANNNYSYSPNRLPIIIGSLIAAVVIAGIVCLIVFRKQISWAGWQHIIGSIGGLVFYIIAFIAFYTVFEDSSEAAGCIFGAVITGLITVLNTVLLFTLVNDYRIIFYWLTAYTLIAGGFMIFTDFDSKIYMDDAEGICGIVQIVISTITFLSLIAGILISANIINI